MPTKVADVRANANENIVHAANKIGRSKHRRQVFDAIYRGQKQAKSIQEIMAATRLSNVRATQEAQKLYAAQIVGRRRISGSNAFEYIKDEFYASEKNKILKLIDNPSEVEKIATKQNPKTGIATTTYNIIVPGKRPKVTAITIDDVDSFREVRSVNSVERSLRLSTWAESRIKKGLQEIIGEHAEFKDWGGEKNDFSTNKLELKGKRIATAFALKGKATKGTLTPRKMGKNGDQIARLIGSPAEVFFVVYHGKIDDSITAQLQAFSIAKSMGGSTVYYGTIDGDDLNRLVQAYPNAF